jgi:hypothetical protein
VNAIRIIQIRVRYLNGRYELTVYRGECEDFLSELSDLAASHPEVAENDW